MRRAQKGRGVLRKNSEYRNQNSGDIPTCSSPSRGRVREGDSGFGILSPELFLLVIAWVVCLVVTWFVLGLCPRAQGEENAEFRIQESEFGGENGDADAEWVMEMEDLIVYLHSQFAHLCVAPAAEQYQSELNNLSHEIGCLHRMLRNYRAADTKTAESRKAMAGKYCELIRAVVELREILYPPGAARQKET